VLAVIFGILCAAAGGYAFYLGTDDEADVLTLELMKYTAYACIAVMDYSICGYFYGKYLKKAAEERDVKMLRMLGVIWFIQDLILVTFVIICVVIGHIYYFLLVLAIAAVDFYRLVIISKFIRECEENYHTSASYCA